MKYALTVRIGERSADRLHDPKNLVLARPLTIDHRFQGFALNKLHDQVRLPVVVRVIKNRHDVWMVKLGNYARFPLEPLSELRILLESWVQHLDCHVAIEIGVVGLKNRGHPALTELLDNAIWTNVFAVLKWHLDSLEDQTKTLKLWEEYVEVNSE